MIPGVRQALVAPGTWVGFTGTVLVATAASDLAWVGEKTWLPAPFAAARTALPIVALPVLTLVGVALLVVAWWLLRPRATGTTADARAVLALWAVPLVASPLILSSDAYGYADLGWTLLQGLDPYTTGLRTTGSPFAFGIADYLSGVRWGYPGLGIAINGWSAAITSFHPYWGVVAQRLPAWGGVALMGICIPRIAVAAGVERATALWFGILNPVVVLHLLGGAHNDALMTGLGLLAVAIAIDTRGSVTTRLVLASCVLGLAVAVKPQVGLLAVAVAGLPVKQRLETATWGPRVRLLGLRTAASGAIAALSFLAASFASGAGIGWIGLMGHLDILVTISPTDLVAMISGPNAIAARSVASVAFPLLAVAAVLALFLFRAFDPLSIAAWGSVAVVLGSPALHPWYVVLPLALLALLPLSRRMLFRAAVVVVAYPVAAYTAALLLKRG